MIVDKTNSFVLGSGEYPDWFKSLLVEYTYESDGVTLKSAIIRNPTGDKVQAFVGDRIAKVDETSKGTICFVLPRRFKQQ